jgi:hypothetical protein
LALAARAVHLLLIAVQAESIQYLAQLHHQVVAVERDKAAAKLLFRVVLAVVELTTKQQEPQVTLVDILQLKVLQVAQVSHQVLTLAVVVVVVHPLLVLMDRHKPVMAVTEQHPL